MKCVLICVSIAEPLIFFSNKKYMGTGQGAVAKISSGLGKIKGALRPNHPIEGAMFPSDLNELPFVENILQDCDNMFRNLNRWKISITSAVSFPPHILIKLRNKRYVVASYLKVRVRV